ncbi:molybdenum cofactor guanylyltransferase [Flavobacterium algicola]|uniref:molybdenum cofactor guanylyltransferase n=1 Tax=Flavobacterium algicola TaxID=556529 RepID=UPI001EFCC6A8|nr:molybdenum cofactor guanylyltransferase [Flavobacterium algicola]MCG9791268.1 molybdenum cofactor guanylyltransferase [Flavobacterium algicola]
MEKQYTAYILAGGKSQRMGTDKGLLTLNGETFISHICTALKPLVGENIVIVSSNEDYDELGFPRIEDLIDNKGPVGGIYTALKHSKTKFNFILSVDTPLVSSDLLAWLAKSHDDGFMMTQLKVGQKASPLIAIYDRSCNTLCGEHIAGNQLKLRRLIDELSHQTLDVPEKWSKQIQNINTPEEYKNIQS